MSIISMSRNIHPSDDGNGLHGMNRESNIIDLNMESEFWAIGGGKGGVGKSFISSNLGILLSRKGGRVLMVDADIGAANLHTFLGTEGARYPLSGFLKGEVSDIKDVISRTSIPNLDILSGAKDSLDVTDFGAMNINHLWNGLKETDYDYVLLDTGPGTSSNLLELFLIGDEGILITSPEPTSIENMYRFIKGLVLRRMKKVLESWEDRRLKELLKNAFTQMGKSRPRTFRKTFEFINTLNVREAREMEEARDQMKISVIVNQARTTEDKQLGPFIKRACRDFFGVSVNYLGYISYDESVTESIRKRKPLTVYYKDSLPVKELEGCLHGIITEKKRLTA